MADDENETVDVQIEESKSGDDNEIKVEVEGDNEPEAAKIEAKKLEISPKEGIDALKKRLAAEKAAREEAERRAYAAQQRAARANVEIEDSNYQIVVNAIGTVRDRAVMLRKAYAEAMSAGDFEKVAEIQEAIAVNTSNFNDLEKGRRAMEEAAKAQSQRSRDSDFQQAPQGDIVDQLAARVTPRSATWLKENREHIGDERAVRRMFRAHEDAVDEGISPDSDDYFAFIENRMGISPRAGSGDAEEEAVEVRSAPRRAPVSAPPPAAPVSRGSTRPGVVRLTRQEADMARTMNMTEKEYAQNKIALKREGKLGV